MKKIIICILISVSCIYAQDLGQSREMKRGNIIAGSCMLGTIYFANIYTVIDGASGKLLIPITGPFQTEGMEGDNPSSPGFYVCIGIATAEAIGTANEIQYR